MVKIRYSELPAGLHVAAEARGRSTIIYLLPGLTAAQRRSALSRVRSSARMGHSPKLPALAMALAITSDRIRTTLRNAGRAVRGHPVLLLPPVVVLVCAAIVLVLMSFVTLTIHQPFAFGPTISRPHVVTPSHGASPFRGHRPDSRRPSHPAGMTGGSTGSSRGRTARLAPSPPAHFGRESSSRDRTATLPPSATHAPTSSPVPSPRGSGSLCVKLGPVGLCVHV